MERGSKGHREETLNLRSFYLRLLRKIWIIPVAAVIGAIIAGGIYTLATVTFGPAKAYKAEAKLYISFAYDENKGTQVDYYNAFTWNMFMTTDDIFIPMVEELKAQKVIVVESEGHKENLGDEKYISVDELKGSITADIPSDVRVMLLTVKNSDIELADKIVRACVKSLEEYGRSNKAFDSIKLLELDDARLIVYSDRSKIAAIFGAVCAVVLVIFAMLLIASLDDAVYVPEDSEKRYGVDNLGILFPQGNDFFRNELVAAFGKATEGMTEVAVISADSIENESRSAKDLAMLEKVLDGTAAVENIKLIPMSVPGTVLENYRKIRTCDGVILCVPFGARNGAMTEHILTQLKKHECPVVGTVISRADLRFMKRYYGL